MCQGIFCGCGIHQRQKTVLREILDKDLSTMKIVVLWMFTFLIILVSSPTRDVSAFIPSLFPHGRHRIYLEPVGAHRNMVVDIDACQNERNKKKKCNLPSINSNTVSPKQSLGSISRCTPAPKHVMDRRSTIRSILSTSVALSLSTVTLPSKAYSEALLLEELKLILGLLTVL